MRKVIVTGSHPSAQSQPKRRRRCGFPTAFLGDKTYFQPVDDGSARVTLTKRDGSPPPSRDGIVRSKEDTNSRSGLPRPPNTAISSTPIVIARPEDDPT